MSFIHFLEQHMIPCPSMALLHLECPGCGMQRSMICLLKGEWTNSLAYHPATIPLVVLIVYSVLHLIFKFNKGARIIIFLQLMVAFITMSFYIYKVSQYKIFN